MADVANLKIQVKSAGIKQAKNELGQLENQGLKTEKAATRLASSFKTAGIAAGVAAVAFTGFATARSIRDISKFTQAIADLSAITGATGEDLAFYADSAKEIGRTTSLSASQAVQAFKLIGSAKPDLLANAAALEAVTKSAVTLAEAAGIELPQAASALGSALNQFGLDADKADEVINLLAASSKFGAAEIPAVTEALRNVGSAANALDVDIAETVAGIQALAVSGRQGADAGTGLRQVLLRLEKTADKELQPSIVGLSGALENLQKRSLNNAELMQLFGDEAFAVASALLEQSGTVAQLNENLRGTSTATEQASIRMDTLEGDSKELSSAVEGLSIEFGEKLEPNLRAATQTLTAFINEITQLISGKSSVSELEKELKSLTDSFDNSVFFGPNSTTEKSILRKEIEAVRAELLGAKADAGDIGSIEALIASKNKELSAIENFDGPDGVARFKNRQKPELLSEISELEAALVKAREKAAAPKTAKTVAGTPAAVVEVKALESALEKYNELIPISERYNKSLRTPLEIYNDEIQLLEQLKNTRLDGSSEALLSNENFARGSAAAYDQFSLSLEKSNDKFADLNEKAVEGENLFSNLQSASERWSESFAESLVEGGSGFESFANGILKQLQKIAIEKAFAPVFSGFAGVLGTIGQGLLGGGAAAFTGSGANSPMFATVGPSFDGGGFTGNGPRSGGLDGKGGFPALIHPQETIIDHTKGQSMGGSTSIVVNVDASGSSVQGDQDGRGLGNMIGVAVRSVLIEESRPGGMLA